MATEPPRSFEDALSRALNSFLDSNSMSQIDAVRKLGIDEKKGKSRLSTYCKKNGPWPRPGADFMYLLCTKLGFSFDYQGYRISAASLNGNGEHAEPVPEQLLITFEGQFDLTTEKRTMAVQVKRPPGRIEISLHMGDADDDAYGKTTG